MLCSRTLRSSTYPPQVKSLSRQGRGRAGVIGTLRLKHCRLTISPARTDMPSLIRDAVRLAAAAPGKGTSLG
jgi:hypothetical protein